MELQSFSIRIPRPLVSTDFGKGCLLSGIDDTVSNIVTVRLKFAIAYIPRASVQLLTNIPETFTKKRKNRRKYTDTSDIKKRKKCYYVMGRFNLKAMERIILRRRCWHRFIADSVRSHDQWHLFWGTVTSSNWPCKLNQRFNGFENHLLSSKDDMELQIRRAEKYLRNKSLKEVFTFRPRTYVLPEDMDTLRHEIPTTESTFTKASNLFIAKPSGLNRGQGIFLFRNLFEYQKKKDHSLDDGYVVQKYVADPLLIHGYKFDLRLYVLVTSFWPLRLHIYKDGLVRFCSQPYRAISEADINNPFRQLTNYSVNKKNAELRKKSVKAECISPDSKDFVAAEKKKNTHQSNEEKVNVRKQELKHGQGDQRQKPADHRREGESEAEFFRRVIGPGAKWTLQQFWQYVEARRSEFPKGWMPMWDKICDVILLVFLSGSFTVESKIGPFGLFGVDVMFDRKKKVILLETNSFPALHMSTMTDKKVKGNMINDLFNLLRLDNLPNLPSVSRHELCKYLFEKDSKIREFSSQNVNIDALLEVSGAGNWLVNGEYISQGRCNGFVRYQKCHRNYIVQIYVAEMKMQQKMMWWISRVDSETMQGKPFHYYAAQVQTGKTSRSGRSLANIPPIEGWFKVSASGSVPKVKLKKYSEFRKPATSEERLKIREVLNECTRLDESKKGGFHKIFPFSKTTREVARLQSKNVRMRGRHEIFPSIVNSVAEEISRRAKLRLTTRLTL